MLVKPGDVVWDVGGNIGLYARWLVSNLKAGHVCSFEPMSENLPELRYNIKIGGIEGQVTVVACALSDKDGEAEFRIDDMQSASGSISVVTGGQASPGRRAVGLPPKTEKVRCRSIDSILSAGELPRPNVLKIDVEGAERMLLDGGGAFFSEGSPRMVIETHGLDVSRRCLEFLYDAGYQVAACVPEGIDKSRHMLLDRSYIERMRGQYDAHFIMASKSAADLPRTLVFPGA